MSPGGDQWPDSRLNDLANSVSALREVPMNVALLAQRLEDAVEDMKQCRHDIAKVAEQFERQGKERARDRKQDRRWLIGTALTTVALVIAAIGLFLQGIHP